MKVISKTSCALLLSPTLLVVPLLAYLYELVKQDPNVLFKVPRYGFILHDIYTTHFQIGENSSKSDTQSQGLTPVFIDESTFLPCYEPYSASNDNKRCAWLKPGDVVVASCAKCGTNWLMTIAHELRVWDKPDLKEFEDIMDIVPWPEQIHYPGETIEERVANWGQGWNRPKFPYRAFKTHFAPHLLPVEARPDVKFLVMMRNPVDAIRSAVEFFPKHTDDLRRVWGGFPPENMDIDMLMSMVAQPNSYLSNLGFSKYWKLLNDEIEEKSKEKLAITNVSGGNFSSSYQTGSSNVLLLHYTDVFANPRPYIRKIAKFLGINITEQGVKTVERRTSFTFMKQRNDKYRYRVKTKDGKDIFMLKGDAIINTGGIGEKKAELISKENINKLEDMAKRILGREIYEIATKGFDYEENLKKQNEKN